MNKRYTFLIIILLVASQFIQAKTVWDFAGKGFSAATLTNLAADNTRWTVSSTTRIVNAVTMSGELTANGATIAETAGIKFASTSSGRINIDHGYVPPRLNLSNSGVSFTLQGLYSGHKITIVTMTANGTSARGINCTTNNATRISGDATSLVENINVFTVNSTVTTPSDVTFITTVGGVHIRSIVVEGNEVINPDGPLNIAYLFDSSYPGNTVVGTDNDNILQQGLMQKNVYPIDVKNFTNDTAKVFVDSLKALEKYNVVVVTDAMSQTHPFGMKLKNLVNRVPMLNLKASFYNSDSWNWGASRNPSDVSAGQNGIDKLTVMNAFTKHPAFESLDITDGLTLYNGTILNKNLVQGYTLNEGSMYANDSLLASVVNGTDTIKAIHKHGDDNSYLLIPLSSEAASTLNANAVILVYNAAIHLAMTKTEVVPALKPSIAQEYFDGYTMVSLTSGTPNAVIHYTLDGTVPTVSSPVYTTKFQLSDTLTVTAIALKQGYDDSPVASVKVSIKTKVSAPVISVVSSENGKTITISGNEGTLYYTTNGATPSASTATPYTVPFTVKRPCTVKVVAIMTNRLNSDIASQVVTFDGYIAREKTLVWANFNTQPTTWVWLNAAGRDTTNGDVIAKYAYTPPTEADPTLKPLFKSVDFKNGFMVGTLGQRINLQMTAVATTSSYSPFTDGDGGASDRAISFLTTNASTDPTTAYMSTTSAYPGPFDVVVWFTGAKGNNALTEKLEVAVSTTNDSISTWAVLDTMSSISDRYIRKRVAYYDATTPVYVRFKSVSN
ncbi:MAG TPA: chitobiase/beta-hexosaminidase C-terminal domain-containing protein, partial [Bacteroidales bacterium]|nr:chitobiase/beta-hexosaminidase C-terminal domain-containing protein [Bacteroidales bacterium]